jgi:hypothetical protein
MFSFKRRMAYSEFSFFSTDEEEDPQPVILHSDIRERMRHDQKRYFSRF